VKNLEFFAGATWLETKPPAVTEWNVIHMPYTPRFQFQAGAKWTFLENFRLTMDMQHMSNGVCRNGLARGASLGGSLITVILPTRTSWTTLHCVTPV